MKKKQQNMNSEDTRIIEITAYIQGYAHAVMLSRPEEQAYSIAMIVATKHFKKGEPVFKCECIFVPPPAELLLQ